MSYRIRRRQVDAQPAGLGRQQKHENVRVLRVQVDHLLPVGDGRLAVQPQKAVLADLQILFDNVQHHDKLAEDQHPVALALELRQQLVQLAELSRSHDQLFRDLQVV